MGNIDKNRPRLDSFKKEQRMVAETIKQAQEELSNLLVKEIEKSGITVNQRALTNEVDMYLRKVENDLQEMVYKAVEKSYTAGEAQHLIAMQGSMSVEEAKKIIKSKNPSELYKGVPFPSYDKSLTDEAILEMAHKRLKDEGLTVEQAKKLLPKTVLRNQAIRSLYSDTYRDILFATQNTSAHVKTVVRETVRDVLQYKALKDRGYEAQAEILFKRLTKKGLSERVIKDGFVGITDKAGRRWNLETYSNMVIKTKTNQAFRQGEIDFAETSGMDLAVISSHGAKDACRNWEGVVVSLTGATKGYPTLQEAIATNEVFHPNCQHSLHVIRDLDSLHGDDIDRHNRKLTALGDYQEREYKRK